MDIPVSVDFLVPRTMATDRTELIMLITPRVIRTRAKSVIVTDEFKAGLEKVRAELERARPERTRPKPAAGSSATDAGAASITSDRRSRSRRRQVATRRGRGVYWQYHFTTERPLRPADAAGGAAAVAADPIWLARIISPADAGRTAQPTAKRRADAASQAYL